MHQKSRIRLSGTREVIVFFLSPKNFHSSTFSKIFHSEGFVPQNTSKKISPAAGKEHVLNHPKLQPRVCGLQESPPQVETFVYNSSKCGFSSSKLLFKTCFYLVSGAHNFVRAPAAPQISTGRLRRPQFPQIPYLPPPSPKFPQNPQNVKNFHKRSRKAERKKKTIIAGLFFRFHISEIFALKFQKHFRVKL